MPNNVEFAVGMKVMVTMNLATDLDLANRACGEVMEIALDKGEPPLPDDQVVHLHYLPAYILVKMNRTHATQLPGLAEQVIPIKPMAQMFRIIIKDHQNKKKARTIQHRQYPITAAYTFTNYRSQGQMIPYVVVDIASPPIGGLTLFNLYVALS